MRRTALRTILLQSFYSAAVQVKPISTQPAALGELCRQQHFDLRASRTTDQPA
jgi:hypothetical protein